MNSKEHIDKAIEREKWYPMIKATNFEMQLAYMLNAFLDNLKDMNEEEIHTALKVYKVAMMNIALAINKEL